MWADHVYTNVRTELAYTLARLEEYDEALWQLVILAEKMCAAGSLTLGKYGYGGNKFLDTLEYERTIPDEHRGVLEDLLSRNVFDRYGKKRLSKRYAKE